LGNCHYCLIHNDAFISNLKISFGPVQWRRRNSVALNLFQLPHTYSFLPCHGTHHIHGQQFGNSCKLPILGKELR